MDIVLYIGSLKTVFLPYIKSIQSFHFYYNNPLFWVFFMVLYLILWIGRSWNRGKAFFFCISIASILLATTWLEKPLIDMFTVHGYAVGGFDPFILKVASLVMISIIVIYFVFVDNS
nr:hypothetical protein [Candidatus Omnitrophota bacterium]